MDPWRHERKEKWRELPDSQFRTTNEMFTIKKKLLKVHLHLFLTSSLERASVTQTESRSDPLWALSTHLAVFVLRSC